MSNASQKKDVSSSLSKLSIDNPSTKPTKSEPKEAVADSWEDEDVSSGSDREAPQENTKKASKSMPSAPPPTPISPSTYSNKTERSWPPASEAAATSVRRGSGAAEARRPEKTDAVARRMIAGALGMNAMKPTAEQKAYDKAVREQAKRIRDGEKEAEKKRQADAEKAKASIWED